MVSDVIEPCFPTFKIIFRCLVAIYFSVVLGNDDETYGVIYEVIYEVIQANSGASLGPLWAVKVTRNIE